MVACYSIEDDKLFPFNFYPSENLTMTYECSPGLLNLILGDTAAVLRSLHILFQRNSNIKVLCQRTIIAIGESLPHQLLCKFNVTYEMRYPLKTLALPVFGTVL